MLESMSRSLAPSLISLAALGCSYDWSVAAGADAALDATTDAGLDAMTDAGLDAGIDASPPDAATCVALRAEAARLRALAKKCVSNVGACDNVVFDECKCPSIVDRDPQANADYKNAADALRTSGCSLLGCGGSCGSSQHNLCILADGGTACAQ